MIYNQFEFDIRLEWGIKGVELLSPISDVIIIVDILSFSTCVDIVLSNNSIVFPYKYKDNTSIEYAKNLNAELASFDRNDKNKFTLSPTSLQAFPSESKLVLPSPNGSTLSLSTGETITLCGCLRNSKAVAEYAMSLGKKISVIPSGELWKDNTLRPSFEDFIGAGAIISYLKGELSPESKSALSTFLMLENNIKTELYSCSSGKELIHRGFKSDVELASEIDFSNAIPYLDQVNKFYFNKNNEQN
jgi:2-phosphosulfolactate phosphatase